jgi:hypothetical protein
MDLVRQGAVSRRTGGTDHAVDLPAVAAHDAGGLGLETTELGRLARVDEELHEDHEWLGLVRGRHGSGAIASREDSLTEDARDGKPRRP